MLNEKKMKILNDRRMIYYATQRLLKRGVSLNSIKETTRLALNDLKAKYPSWEEGAPITIIDCALMNEEVDK